MEECLLVWSYNYNVRFCKLYLCWHCKVDIIKTYLNIESTSQRQRDSVHVHTYNAGGIQEGYIAKVCTVKAKVAGVFNVTLWA